MREKSYKVNMIYFISDTHFDHANIISLCNRPFATIEAMNEALIRNWNRKVHADDTIYIIGDLFFRTSDPERILRRLKGKKHLVIGNHDGQWMGKINLDHYFESVNNYLQISDGQRGMVLCHYPQMEWSRPRHTYMIHGHIHGNTDMDYWPMVRSRDHLLNAGCDINNYEPVSFRELVDNNARFKAQHQCRAE